MISFNILKRSKKSRARLGILKTPHGEIETPALVAVATQAAVKTLEPHEIKESKSQILISNTYHLHLKPGETIVKKSGGLHGFMNWDRPLMTDSGGFQVFSLGFGSDSKVGKILKYFPGEANDPLIPMGTQPKYLRITDDGVHFRSPIQGDELFIGPRESMNIQEALGADIIFAFDECTSPLSTKEYIIEALRRTHDWAKKCIQFHKTDQALFGIVQGSHYKELRKESARFINSLDFPGFGIGGDLGSSKNDMRNILRWTVPYLAEEKPRHLLGIGYLEDMEPIAKEGIDTFDCIVPTHYARRGIAFTGKGKLDLQKPALLKDKKPLDPRCDCRVCAEYTRSYISHLFRAKEIGALKLITFHNLFLFNSYVEKIREKIKKGIL